MSCTPNRKLLHMMESKNNLKLGTWNLCLGLPNKKDIVTSYLRMQNVDVCCLQETEVPVNFPEAILNTGGYNLELELSDGKKRAGMYLRKEVTYKRREDLESKNSHVVICDLITVPVIRVISIYRSFRPPGMLSPEMFFTNQLAILSNAVTDNCIILGDFNLDAVMEHRVDYSYKIPMKCLTTFSLSSGLTQLVNFKTWSRTIKGCKKESLLDHVYVKNFTSVDNTTFSVPVFGDHVLVQVDLNIPLYYN